MKHWTGSPIDRRDVNLRVRKDSRLDFPYDAGKHVRDGERDMFDEGDWPVCLNLWQCVGCGSMGNSNECTGACAFKRVMVIDVERHADLLEYFLTLSERLDSLRELARQAAAACESEKAFLAGGERLRTQAKKLLQSTPETQEPPIAAEERNEVWECTSCGQVEAPRECLGICIRRKGEFVRGEDHDALSARIEKNRRDVRRLTTFARQIGWAVPRPGQSERTLEALRTMADELLNAA